MAFKKAERTQLWLRCALFGPSGSGKTKSALRIAKGIADKMGVPLAVIDTEARSASKYADETYVFDVDDLNDKTIDGYLASMRNAAQAGYKMLVIDSLSHAWRELTEEVDRIAQKNPTHNTFRAWGQAGPKQKALIDAILNYPGHVIATMRSKTEWVIGEGKNGKMAPEKLGLAPEQGKGIEYEFDLLIELNQQRQGIVTKDRTGKFQDDVRNQPDEAFGEELLAWLSQGSAPPAARRPVEQQAAKTVPSKQPRNTAAAKTAETKPAAPIASANDIQSRGRAVIDEIGKLVKTAAENGEQFFSEEEIAQARELVKGTPSDIHGLKQLEEFKVFLANEVVRRKGQREAEKRAA